jgi:hypothetical protein
MTSTPLTRSGDPAIRAVVDRVLTTAGAGPAFHALLDHIAEALRADHPTDWAQRIQRLWELVLAAGEVWTPGDGMKGLEYTLRVLIDELAGSGFAVSSRPASTPQGRLAALIAAQGGQPVENIDDLAFPDWPEDESVDDFVATVRAWREEREPPSHS